MSEVYAEGAGCADAVVVNGSVLHTWKLIRFTLKGKEMGGDDGMGLTRIREERRKQVRVSDAWGVVVYIQRIAAINTR